MADVQEISTVSDFQANVREYLARAKQTAEPIVLTESGAPEFVLMTVAEYEAMRDRLEEAAFVEAVMAGEADIQAGRVRPVNEVEKDLRVQLGL